VNDAAEGGAADAVLHGEVMLIIFRRIPAASLEDRRPSGTPISTACG
jgi:hypothetical protein